MHKISTCTEQYVTVQLNKVHVQYIRRYVGSRQSHYAGSQQLIIRELSIITELTSVGISASLLGLGSGKE